MPRVLRTGKPTTPSKTAVYVASRSARCWNFITAEHVVRASVDHVLRSRGRYHHEAGIIRSASVPCATTSRTFDDLPSFHSSSCSCSIFTAWLGKLFHPRAPGSMEDSLRFLKRQRNARDETKLCSYSKEEKQWNGSEGSDMKSNMSIKFLKEIFKKWAAWKFRKVSSRPSSTKILNPVCNKRCLPTKNKTYTKQVTEWL